MNRRGQESVVTEARNARYKVGLIALGVIVLIGVLFFIGSRVVGKAITPTTPILMSTCTPSLGWVLGNTYQLTQDLTVNPDVSAVCIQITEPNIVLDCAGHTITGSGTGVRGSYGAILGVEGGAVVGITLKNCRITNFGTGVLVYASGSLLLNNEVYGNAVGIDMISLSSVSMDGSVIHDNTAHGIGLTSLSSGDIRTTQSCNNGGGSLVCSGVATISGTGNVFTLGTPSCIPSGWPQLDLDYTRCVSPELCADGIDNDGDGLIDCADVENCRTERACCVVASGLEVCDGIDNDCDGVVDGPVVCTGDLDCGTFGNACSSGQICRDGVCVTGGCRSDADCASTPSTPACNLATGMCEARHIVINNGDYDNDGQTSSASDAVKFNWHLLFGQLLTNAGKTYAGDTCGAAGENPCPIGDTGKFICDNGKGLASNANTPCPPGSVLGDYDNDGKASSPSDAVKFNWHLLFGQLLTNAGKTYASDTCGAAGENPCPIGDTGKFICDNGKGLASTNQALCT